MWRAIPQTRDKHAFVGLSEASRERWSRMRESASRGTVTAKRAGAGDGIPPAGPGLPGVFDALVNPANPNARQIIASLHPTFMYLSMYVNYTKSVSVN